MHDIRLTIFIAVVETGSFSAAAEMLHMTQPAISSRIQGLEERLDVKLFNRDRKGVTLTNAGEAFYEKACLINELWDQTLKEVRLHGNKFDSKLEIIGSPTVGQYILPSLIQEFRETHKYANAAIFNGNNNEVIDKIANNQVHLGFIAGHHTHDKLVIEELFWDEMILVVSSRHPWTKSKTISPKDILTDRIILREPGSGTCQLIEQEFDRLGIDLSNQRFFLEFANIEAMKSAVIDDYGCSIISKFAVKRELNNGSLVEIKIKKMTFKRPINAVYGNIKHLPEIYQKFISFTRNAIHAHFSK